MLYNGCMDAENWKQLPGFEAYEVSDHGNVRRISPGKGTRPMRQLRPCLDHGGRMVFNARKDGKVKQWKVHRAVMQAFCGDCPEGMEVAHLDGDQTNNRLTNLAYATPVENNSHKVGHGTQPKGVQIWCSKLTEDQVLEIRARSPQISYAKLATEYGVSLMTIAQVITRKTWKHV
jgi:hypothetical protein